MEIEGAVLSIMVTVQSTRRGSASVLMPPTCHLNGTGSCYLPLRDTRRRNGSYIIGRRNNMGLALNRRWAEMETGIERK